jgi:hypothetical protein
MMGLKLSEALKQKSRVWIATLHVYYHVCNVSQLVVAHKEIEAAPLHTVSCGHDDDIDQSS